MGRIYPKRVFCIEGNWEEKLSRRTVTTGSFMLLSPAGEAGDVKGRNDRSPRPACP